MTETNGGGRHGARAWILAPLLVAWLVWYPSLGVPLLLDDLVAVAILEPEDGSPSRLGRVLWPDDEKFDFNHHLRPLGWLSMALDHRLFGGIEPASSRSVAITLHGLMGVLAAGLALVLGVRSRAAAAVAGSFVVAHGAAFEPVIWICHRFTILSGLTLVLAGLAADRLARRGGPTAVSLLLVALALHVFSKDSGLAFGASVVTLVLVRAPAENRLRRTLIAGAVFVSVAAGNLGLRRLATGHWLPAYDTDAASSASLFDRVGFEGALANAEALLRPVLRLPDDPALITQGSWVLAGGLLGLVTAGLLQRRAWPVFFWFLVAFAASLPQVVATDGTLAGSRAVYPLIPLLGVLCAFGAERLTPRVAVLVVLLICGGARLAHRPYDQARILVTDTVTIAEDLAQRGGIVRLDGLVDTRHGAPVHGPGEHLNRRFLPPLRTEAADVGPLAAVDLPSRLTAPLDHPLRWRPLSLDEKAVRMRAEPGLRLPSDEERATSERLVWIAPEANVPFPGEAAMARLVVSLPSQTTRPRSVLVRATADDIVLPVVLPAEHPALQWTEDRLVVLLGPDPFALHPAFAKLAGEARPVTLEIEFLPAAEVPDAGPGSSARSVQGHRAQR